MALNMTQWNGHHGCRHCLDEGTRISRGIRVYLPDDEHMPRTEAQLFEHAQDATARTPRFGVKGLSVLSPYMNIIKDTAIDYMHAVLEGVVKTILHKFWLNGKYKNYPFIFLIKLKVWKCSSQYKATT